MVFMIDVARFSALPLPRVEESVERTWGVARDLLPISRLRGRISHLVPADLKLGAGCGFIGMYLIGLVRR